MYKRKRADLVGVMESTLSPLFLGQLKNLHKSCLLAFKKDMLDGMKGETYNFAEIVNTARTKYEGIFLSSSQELLLKDTQWSYEEEQSLFHDEIRIVADQCRRDETKKMVNLIEVIAHVDFYSFRSDTALLSEPSSVRFQSLLNLL